MTTAPNLHTIFPLNGYERLCFLEKYHQKPEHRIISSTVCTMI